MTVRGIAHNGKYRLMFGVLPCFMAVSYSSGPCAEPPGAPEDVLPPPALSMGLPPRIPLTFGPLVGYDFKREEVTARLFIDATRRRLFGPLELTLEGAAGVSGSSFDAGVGAYAGIPWFLAGAEYNALDGGFDFGLILQFAGMRGGLLRRGDLIRVDYRPGAQEVMMGITFPSPFTKYRMTRPRNRFTELPKGNVQGSTKPLDPALQAKVSEVTHAVEWMDRLLTPRFATGDKFAEDAAWYLDHVQQSGHTFDEENERYHRGLEGAFAYVLGDSALAKEVATRAEAVIYSEVLVPFDSRFGQEKKPNSAGGYCAAAARKFAEYLESHPAFQGPDPDQSGRAGRILDVYRCVLKAVEQVSVRARDRWEDSFLFFNSRDCLAWLPLNYGLRPAQYDTQEEWNGVLGDLTEQEFENSNYVEYLMTEQFHLQTKTTIREAQDYQVTIVHDFRGKTPDRDVDIYGWDMVVDGYLAAFTQAVTELNQGTRTRLPQFFLFLDENYYQANKSRQIMEYLQNLYDPESPKLKEETVIEQIDLAHATLRAAIETSGALAGLSKEELRRAFRVYVNITNPFDPAIAMDVTRRDHRKIAFCDVTEEDPAAGVAIFTGQGIGEHYNGPGWEDRSVVIRGPVLVQLKDETRRLFMSQGYTAEEVPDCLKPVPFPVDYEERCGALQEERGWTTPVSICANETGYGYKKASVLKTAIYNLAPDASSLLTFDSLWLSDFWASMFITAALRGVHVFPVAPSPRNAPSHATPTLYYLRQNLELMLRAQVFFADEIARNHGLFRVGIYAHAVPVDDLERRMVTFIWGREAYPFLKQEFPFNPAIEALFAQRLQSYEPTSLVKLRLRPRPLLHVKGQLFGTREAFQLIRMPQWGPILGAHLAIRKAQLKGEKNAGITPLLLDTKGPLDKTLKEELEGLSGSERAIFTFTTGSQNQNPRSMLLDGEVLVALGGFNCMMTAIDFMFILGIASWPETMEEFDQLYPEVKSSFPGNILNGLIKYQL